MRSAITLKGTEEVLKLLRDSDSVGRALPLEIAAERIAALHHALDRASYALFCVKRLIDAGPETVEHCRKAYEASIKVLDAE